VKIKTIWAICCVALVVQGCANARFNMDESSSTSKPSATEERHVVFLSGFGQQHTINAGKVCGGAEKVDSVEVEQGFWDSVVALVSWQIYTPLTARVYCK